MRTLIVILAAFIQFTVVGCGPQPPSVQSKTDVDKLDRSVWSISARSLPDDQMLSLGRLKKLRVLDFSHGWGVMPAAITDKGLAELGKLELPKLETLTLGWCENITDGGLDEIARMKTITWLGLTACSRITDAGLPKLIRSKNLTDLDLRGCLYITDDGIQQLAAKSNWKEIFLGGCPRVTAAGVAKLRAALPNARVDKDDQEWQSIIAN